jgi:hypothetical protein
MNFRTTLILLILVCGAVVFLVLANRSGAPSANQKTEERDKGRQLLTVKSSSVRSLVIRLGPGAPAGTQTVELTREKDNWRITQPINWLANSMEASRLVDTITSARSDRAIELTGDKAASTGLNPPRLIIELTDDSGNTQKLAIGNRSALGFLYVRINDEAEGVLLSGGPLSQRLAQSSEEMVAALRDRHLLQLGEAAITQLAIERGPAQPPLNLELRGQQWRLTRPTEEPADREEVSALIEALADLKAEKFADEEPPPSSALAGLDRPRAVVTMSTLASATQPATHPAAAPAAAPAPGMLGGAIRFAIGDADVSGEKCWIRVGTQPPVVARVSLPTSTVKKYLEATPLSLRDRRVLDLDPERIVEVSIASSGGAQAESKTIRLVRRDDPRVGPRAPAEPATHPATAPATQPSARLGVPAFLTATMLLVADAPPATLPATQSATTTPSTLPATRAVQSTKPAATAEPPMPPTKWLLASSGDARADDGSADDLVRRISKLRATRYLEKPPVAAGERDYIVTLQELRRGEGAPSVIVRITDPGEAKPLIGRFGEFTFELDRSLRDLLKKDFVEPPPSPMGGPRGLPPGHPPIGIPTGPPED